MAIGKAWRIGGFVAALAASGGLIASASGATGAYFNDTRSGTLAATIGSVTINTAGGSGTDGLDFNVTNLMPGTPQNQHVSYTVTGTGPEDVYLVFPNAEALHSVNNMGTYGDAYVKSNGTQVFASTNLNDGLAADLTSTGHCATQSPSGCYAIPNIIKLASNLAPGQGGTLDFSIGLAAKWKSTATEGTDPFCYPLIQDSSTADPAQQVCTPTNPSYGLPYQIVATQPGVAPDDPNNSTPTP